MSNQTFLPAIHVNPHDPVHLFISLWMRQLSGRADKMVLDDRLMVAAQRHAEYLDSRTPEQIAALPKNGHGSHTGANNSTPNQRVRAEGYRLPEWHGNGNTVEFNARTHKGAKAALELLLNSQYHRPGLMGEGFWEPATHIGVGHFGNDWVVIAAPAEEI